MTSDQDRTVEAEVRALLDAEVPDFLGTPALADRALVGATRRRRARVRVFGGAGAVTAVAVGVLAAGPGFGWGGRGTDPASAAVTTPGTGAMETLARSSPGPTPTSAPTSFPASAPTSPVGGVDTAPRWQPGPKQEALERVTAKLQGGHIDSFMGAGFTVVQNGTGTEQPWADQTPLVVYRKPIGDKTLESDAITAARPYAVVFKDSVLNASEQWVLGQRLYQDRALWQGQGGGAFFGTALQSDGTITIFAENPDQLLPLMEQHYGYDGRVFVGRKENPPTTPPSGMLTPTH